MKINNIKDNNFNLIRLIAALQVCILHTISHLKLNINIPIIGYFPGVLIFFTTSGFLIYQSIINNSNLFRYFKNRFIRIYPALWICQLLTVFMLLFFNIIKIEDIFSLKILKWLLAQFSFFQFYTANILRNYGVGNPNGSLWTIPVELQFYIILPIVIFTFKKIKLIYKITGMCLISILFNIFLTKIEIFNNSNVYIKLLSVSILPYFFYFGCGILLSYYWNQIKTYIVGKAFLWLFVFFTYIYIFDVSPEYQPKKFSGFIINIILSILTISFAHTLPKISRILKGQDYSYGIYIYHMLVINCIVQLGYINSLNYFILSILVTIILAILSWNIIEKRVLILKK